MDPLNKGHNRNNLSIKDASQGPKYSLLIYLREDNLSIKVGPNMSFIWMLHRIANLPMLCCNDGPLYQLQGCDSLKHFNKFSPVSPLQGT